MASQVEPPPPLDALATNLEVLSSPVRLELLRLLRRPRALHEIRLKAGRARSGENPDRVLTRQGVARHLEVLQDAQLVRRVPARNAREGEHFALNHERLFALVDEMRNLTKLRPLMHATGLETSTLEGDASAVAQLPDGPRLLVAYGRDDGQAFSLLDQGGEAWRIGRSPACEIQLDYDPFLSGVHATLLPVGQGGFALRDEGSKNGTFVNWARLAPGKERPLRSGDLITVGRSVLVMQV